MNIFKPHEIIINRYDGMLIITIPDETPLTGKQIQCMVAKFLFHRDDSYNLIKMETDTCAGIRACFKDMT